MRIAIGVSLVVLLLASLFIWLAAGRAIAPLQALSRTARTISETDLSGRIPVRGGDEIAELGRTFNGMLDRLEIAFADQKDFLTDVSHELRTPITVIRGHLETLGDSPREREEAIAVIQDELDRMSRYVDDLLLLAQGAAARTSCGSGPIDLDLFTHDLFAKARSLGDRDWRLDGTGVGIVVADQQRLTQAVMNLAENAVRHTRRRRLDLARQLAGRRSGAALGPRRGPRRSTPPTASGSSSRYARGDTAPAAVGRRRARARRSCAAIAEAHGGRVELDSQLGLGATFTIVLPARAAGAVSRILIAEDEARLASFLEKGLRASGFTTTVVGDGPDAERARQRRRLRPADPRPRPARQGRPRGAARPARATGSRLPVIVLTARGDPHDRVAGLETRRRRLPGEAVSLRGAGRPGPGPAARRRIAGREQTQLRVGGVALDLRTRWASVDGETVELSAREFELLRTFLQHPNQVLSREQLLARVWGYDYDPGSNVVDVYVGYLRQKLGGTRRFASDRRAGLSGYTGFTGVQRGERGVSVEQALRKSNARIPSGPSSVQSKKRGLTHAKALPGALVGGLDPELALGQRLAGHLDPAEAAGGLGELEHVDVDLGAEDLAQAAHVARPGELVLVAVEEAAAELDAAARLDQLVAEGAAAPALARLGRGSLDGCHGESLRSGEAAQAARAAGPSN